MTPEQELAEDRLELARAVAHRDGRLRIIADHPLRSPNAEGYLKREIAEWDAEIAWCTARIRVRERYSGSALTVALRVVAGGERGPAVIASVVSAVLGTVVP